MMEFYLPLAWTDPAHMLQLATAAEDAGFTGIAFSDHMLYPPLGVSLRARRQAPLAARNPLSRPMGFDGSYRGRDEAGAVRHEHLCAAEP
jgi:alkanesulfonate monooxygenase SsuD/methylene tetrahydromethanopterin reductase-like flavin-dependent oxidoreductase (luciferase family)